MNDSIPSDEGALCEHGILRWHCDRCLCKALQSIAAFPVGQFRSLEDEIAIWRIAKNALGDAYE